jgi:hypothetical protein
MDDNTKDLIGIILNSTQLLILLISAVWAFFRFQKEGPLHPRIEFDINCRFFGPQKNSYLASFIISANNKGNVEHRFSEIRLKVRGIKTDDLLEEFKEYPPMVNFPMGIMKGINIVLLSSDTFL